MKKTLAEIKNIFRKFYSSIHTKKQDKVLLKTEEDNIVTTSATVQVEGSVKDDLTPALLQELFKKEIKQSEVPFFNQPIEELKLSVRAKNAILKANILTLDQLIQCSYEEVLGFPHIGSKTIDEICSFVKEVYGNGYIGNESVNYEDKTLLEYIFQCDIDFTKLPMKKQSLKGCGFSNRAINSLNAVDIKTLEELIKLEYRIFLHIRQLGKKTREDICTALQKKYSQYLITDGKLNCSTGEAIDDVINTFKEVFLESFCVKIQNILLEAKLDFNSTEEVYMFLYKSPEFLCVLGDSLISKFEELKIYSKTEIAELLPNEFNSDEYVDKILNSLLLRKKIIADDTGYEVNLLTVEEYLEASSSNKNIEILRRRFNGETLEDVGVYAGVTRERIRQIVSKELKKMPVLKPDRLKYFIETYALTAEAYQYITGGSLLSFGYLKIKYQIGDKPLDGISQDMKLPIKYRLASEKYVVRDLLMEDGEIIRKRKGDILSFLLKKHGKNEMTTEKLMPLYNDFIRRHGLDKDKYEIPEERALEALVARLRCTLWRFGKIYRYTPLMDEEVDELIQALRIKELKDVEISTGFFIDRYPAVLQEFDIRDEYELHSLLKKHIDDSNIKFLKMPIISIGNSNREAQVIDLLKENNPISISDLGNMYQAKYGVKAATAQGSFFKCIEQYCVKGIYKMERSELTTDELQYMINILVEDIYEIPAIKSLFYAQFPSSKHKKINAYVINKMGFESSNLLAYRRNKGGIKTGIKKRIKDGILDFSNKPEWLQDTAFYTAIYNMKQNGEIFEIIPFQYATMEKMISVGITGEKIEQYIEALQNFVGEKFFTMHWLEANGFETFLDKYGFEECFYKSLLQASNNVAIRKLGNTTLFRFTDEKITLGDLIENIILRLRSVDIYDFMNILEEQYNIFVEKSKIIYYVRNSDLYYSDTMEKIYIDYDEFYEEV